MNVGDLHTSYGEYLLTCLRMYGVPEQEREDVRQDLYIKLLTSNRDLSNIRYPKGFCSKMARDIACNWRRDNSRKPMMESIVNIDHHGMEGAHPALDAIAMSRWEAVMDNPNAERITEAIELSTTYDLQGGITAYDVIADLLYGLTMEQIGEKHSVDKATISRWMAGWRGWVNKVLS